MILSGGVFLDKERELVYLQEKLNEVRRAKTTAIVSTYIIFFFLGFVVQFYFEIDFIVGLIIWIIAGTGISLTINWYYDEQKARIMQQIRSTNLKTDVGEEKRARVGETTQSLSPTPATILAICPQCKSRVPSESKFCLECGADLRPKNTT